MREDGAEAEAEAALRSLSPALPCPVTVQLLKSADLGRHSLLYLEEIGHGWFGKVSC